MKTAGQLQITESEYDALRKTRDLLASGEVKWQYREPSDEYIEWGHAPKQFNMSMIYTENQGMHGCQTSCCIGGWMAVHMGIMERWEVVNYVNNVMSRSLGWLCFPEPGIMSLIKPAHAVEAIDNFLNTGQPMWRYVLDGVAHVPVCEETEEARHRYIAQSEVPVLSESLAITHKDKADAS